MACEPRSRCYSEGPDMSTATIDYVAKRAELLAQLVLTSRKGVRLVPFTEASNAGVGLVAQLPGRADLGPDKMIQPYLHVQVKGTADLLEDEHSAAVFAKRHWKPVSLLMAPAVFLLFSMEGDRGYFSWMLEPRTERGKGTTLTWIQAPEMTKINKKAIETIFDKVEQWFVATAELLIRDESGK